MDEAVRLLKDGDREGCELITRMLLQDPQLGDLPKTSCHYLLAHSSQDCVYGPAHCLQTALTLHSWHAERAVDLYNHLYELRPGSSFSGRYVPGTKALSRQRVYVDHTEKLLKRLKENDAEIEANYKSQMDAYVAHYGHRPTDEQLVDADMASWPKLSTAWSSWMRSPVKTKMSSIRGSY